VGAITMSMSCVVRGAPWNELANDPVSMYGTPALWSASSARRIAPSAPSSDAIEFPDQLVPNLTFVQLGMARPNAGAGHRSNRIAHLARHQQLAGTAHPSVD
jgi:hypothetical protein